MTLKALEHVENEQTFRVIHDTWCNLNDRISMLQGMLRLLVARSSGSESRFRSTSTCHDKVCRRSIFLKHILLGYDVPLPGTSRACRALASPLPGTSGACMAKMCPYQGLQGLTNMALKKRFPRKNGHFKQDQASAWTLYGASRQAPQEPVCFCRCHRIYCPLP